MLVVSTVDLKEHVKPIIRKCGYVSFSENNYSYNKWGPFRAMNNPGTVFSLVVNRLRL